MKIIAAFIFLFTAPLVLKAYDKTGHRIIAQIATSALTGKASTAIEKLLGKNGLVNYANWADEIKSNHAYDYYYKSHFLNVENSYSPGQLDSLYKSAVLKNSNIIFAIDSLTTALTNNKNDTAALQFLIHFAGDLFQPLHFGKASDLGGNQVRIKWFKDSINLHSLWDSYMVGYEQLSYTEYSGYLLSAQHLTSHTYSLEEAFQRSYFISRRIYGYDYAHINEYLYYYNFNVDLKESLLDGGYFLASLLNKIYA